MTQQRMLVAAAVVALAGCGTGSDAFDVAADDVTWVQEIPAGGFGVYAAERR